MGMGRRPLHYSGGLTLRLPFADPSYVLCATPDALLKLDPKFRDERKMVRRHQGETGAGKLQFHDFHFSLVINVIQVQDGKDARVGAAAPQVPPQVDALEALG